MKIYIDVGRGCAKPHMLDTKVEAARAKEIRERKAAGGRVFAFERELVRSFNNLRRRMGLGTASEVCRVER